MILIRLDSVKKRKEKKSAFQHQTYVKDTFK